MNIVMLGYRGSGKSVIAKILAQRLKRKLICIDKLIAQSAGMPIPEIVEKKGWPRFREMESRIVREVANEDQDSVIDCGGGVVLDDHNVVLLKKYGKAVLLKADLNALLKRIRNDSNRPPLKDGVSFEEEQKIILQEREPKYLAAADLICDTTHRKPTETALEIIEFFQKKSWI
ncbi:MAG: shikimate kinase [Nitrospinaceae bacterium]|nr:MAG: shikimate kinase [Nitrospinaceae bacterium]